MRGPISGAILFRLTKVLSHVLAPGYETMPGLRKAIAKNRARGPAQPPARVSKRYDVRRQPRPDGDVFRLSRRGAKRADLHLLYLHGGAFVLSIQKIQWRVPLGLLDRLEACDATVPLWPLAPEHTWRDSMPYVTSLYLEMVSEYGAENIVITGDSAGGGVAMLLAQHLRDHGEPQPASMILFSPVLDLSVSGPDQTELEHRDPSISAGMIRNAAKLWAPDLDPQDPRVSALFADQRGLPPALVFSGDREVLDSDARRLATRNPTVDHRSYAEMAHVFPIGGTREGTHAFVESVKFIQAHLPGTDMGNRPR
ncbi:alpha/beta hydrolase fold domain-containing protein [Mycobacterium sp. DL440]|uniref:alpha/beta hydrolase fold domain-containing protein n=1 Tax=Mycobacterium sp. DL440 TaxID=2675523 RepID=UPI001422BA00|nr:alpha/beta hydrolase [Mycobacterium sp. DL440]